MNKRMIGATSSAFLCAAGGALGQYHHDNQRSVRANFTPVTPPNKAKMDEMARLTDTAAAALDAGRYAEAEDNARQATSLPLGALRGQELLAAALDAQGKTQEALQAYKVMADTGGVFPRNMLPYALLLLKTGQWAQAVEAYNRQLPYLSDLMLANSHFSPDVPQLRELEAAIHIGLGMTGDFRGHYWHQHNGTAGDPTLSDFRAALALEPASPLANYYYASALRQLGRRDEAKVAYAKAAQLGGDDVKAEVVRFSKL